MRTLVIAILAAPTLAWSQETPPDPPVEAAQVGEPSRSESIAFLNLLLDPSTIVVHEGVVARRGALVEMSARHARTGTLTEPLSARGGLSRYALDAGTPVYVQHFQTPQNNGDAWCAPTSTGGMFGEYSIALCMFPDETGQEARFYPTEAGLNDPLYATSLTSAGSARGVMPSIAEGPVEFARPLTFRLIFMRAQRRYYDLAVVAGSFEAGGARIQQIRAPRGEGGAADVRFMGGLFRLTATGDDRDHVNVEILEPPFSSNEGLETTSVK